MNKLKFISQEDFKDFEQSCIAAEKIKENYKKPYVRKSGYKDIDKDYTIGKVTFCLGAGLDDPVVYIFDGMEFVYPKEFYGEHEDIPFCSCEDVEELEVEDIEFCEPEEGLDFAEVCTVFEPGVTIKKVVFNNCTFNNY